MTIDEEIGTFLNEDAGIAALIGTAAVWLCMLPQGQTQGVVYQQVDGPMDVTFDQRQKTNARWQFTSYSSSPVAARLIHEAVKDALTFLRDALTTEGTLCESDGIEDERGPLFDYERNLYRYDADIVLTY